MSSDLEKLLREFKEKNRWPGTGEAVSISEDEEKEGLDLDFHVMPAGYSDDQEEGKLGQENGLQGLSKKKSGTGKSGKVLIFVVLLLLLGLLLFASY